jgi:hypothetical protein
MQAKERDVGQRTDAQRAAVLVAQNTRRFFGGHRHHIANAESEDATNLGLTRMAAASHGVTRDQLIWTADAYIRPETYKAGLARIIRSTPGDIDPKSSRPRISRVVINATRRSFILHAGETDMVRSLAERSHAREQQKARLAEQEAKLKTTERRARTRRLIEAGTLAAAGL